jgi:superfamily I DNA and RNA helicase
MDFSWGESEGGNYAEKEIWSALKLTLIEDEGLCFHRYPVFSADRSRREPDFLILHRFWGLYIIECKGCKIDNIESIDGATWHMKNWHSSQETPYTQAEDQMFAVMTKFKTESSLRARRECIIKSHVFIALPYITRAEWISKGLDLSPACPTTMIFADDLDPLTLRTRLQQIPAEEKQTLISKEQFDLACGVLQGTPALRREPRPESANPQSKASMMRQVEQQMMSIDKEQIKVAIPIPNGPQRIRGLSGSGKTVVLCMKAAQLHLRFPDWDIAYTFYTNSLHEMIRNLITRFYHYWSDGNPNWEKIHIIQGWGSKNSPGLYRTIAGAMCQVSRSYDEAKNFFAYTKQNEILGKCCEELLLGGQKIPELFDAILIDEGQDFHFNFYKLCYQSLREPKRLIWAYDEVQSLEALDVPTAIDIFGTNPDGSPIVNLEGTYPDGEVEKDIILYHCYRTPRPVLVMAHTFGMGLLRSEGAVQFISKPGGWEDIGYELSGDFKLGQNGEFLVGQNLTIKRPEQNSPHGLEKIAGYQNLVQCKGFDNFEAEANWVAEQIISNIKKDDLLPEEILVISLDWKQSRYTHFIIKQILLRSGIESIIPGHDVSSSIFQKKNCVTLTNIFPAKGNEATVVYVIGFEEVDANPMLIVQARNQAFTAMTRTRGWCILTGVGTLASKLFSEITEILKNPGQITFPVPDPHTIKRNLENLEYEKRRNRIAKADEHFNKFKKILAEIDDPELRKKYIQKLQNV